MHARILDELFELQAMAGDPSFAPARRSKRSVSD